MAQVARVFPYVGGKQRMLGNLLPLLEAVPHKNYAEPFFGSGCVLLAKTPAMLEMANDAWKVVINFFECVKEDGEKLEHIYRQKYWLDHEGLHFEGREIINDEGKDRFERAAAFMYVMCMSHFHDGGTYSYLSPPRSPKICLRGLPDDFRKRLEKVTFSAVDWRQFLKRMDVLGDDTLIYLDPPYPGTSNIGFETNNSGIGRFTDDDFFELLEVLAKARYHWLLSSHRHTGLTTYARNHEWHAKEFEHRTVSNIYTSEGQINTEIVTYPAHTAPFVANKGQGGLLDG